MRSNLENAVCRSIYNQLAGFYMLITIVLDNFGASIRLIAKDFPAGTLCERI